MVVVRVFTLENTYVLDGSVFVTKTARNDTYNGLNMAEQLRILYPEFVASHGHSHTHSNGDSDKS